MLKNVLLIGFGGFIGSIARYYVSKLNLYIEIIDKTEALHNFYSKVEKELLTMSKGCLVVIEPIKVVLHKEGKTNG